MSHFIFRAFTKEFCFVSAHSLHVAHCVCCSWPAHGPLSAWLQRFVESPIIDDATGQVLVPAGTHVLLFADDFSSVAGWPIFSTGHRACAGTQFARAYLPVLQRALVGHERFHPEAGHLWSGRNNDSNMGTEETLYFVRTVVRAMFFCGKHKVPA
jgi:hypothetical protein